VLLLQALEGESRSQRNLPWRASKAGYNAGLGTAIKYRIVKHETARGKTGHQLQIRVVQQIVNLGANLDVNFAV